MILFPPVPDDLQGRELKSRLFDVNQQQDGDKEARCDMQITDMELGLASSGKSDESVLYGTT